MEKEIRNWRILALMDKEPICEEQFGLKNSFADGMYPLDQLLQGIEIEMEHTEDNPEGKKIAKCIAKNHLEEQRSEGKEMNYYTLLKDMESKFTKKV